MTNKKIDFLLFGLVLLASFLVYGRVLAQDSSVGIKMQPAIIEELVKPGEVFRSSLYITNVSNSEKIFYLVSRDISTLSPSGAPIFVEPGEQNEYSLSSWIKTSESSITVKAGETREVPISVIIPSDAAPGGHFAGLFASLKPPKLTSTGTGVGYEVATIVSLQVAGDITEEARIRQFATGKFIYTNSEVDFKTIVENMGNVLVRARGPLEITDIFGKKVANLVVNDQGAVVLPDSSREFGTIWNGEGLTIGRYQAVLGLVYGSNGRKTITATTSFWVLPLNFILVALSGIIGFIVLFFTITHLYIRRKLSRLGGGSNKDVYGLAKGSAPRNLMLTLTILIAVTMLVVLMMIFFA